MTAMKGALPLLAAAALVLATIAFFAFSREDRPKHTGPRRAPAETPAETPGTTADPATQSKADPKIDGLLRSGDAGITQAAAASLRRLLRTDPAARERAADRLLAEETPRELRMALAFVLGTLPGADPVLREALARFGDDADVARCLIFALGATREPLEDDDVFGLGDQPWGVSGPQGLGITVRRSIEDPETRAAIATSLADERGPVREAAAIALRHSTRTPQVRSEFLAAVRGESSDDVALVLGEALAVWAGSVRTGSERTEIVRTLLARVGDEGLDGFRFRMEDDFRRIALDESHQATLAEYAQPARAYTVRSFALSALAAGAPERARVLLEECAAGDRETAVRDLAARLLGSLPESAGTIRVLVAASRGDKAWNVRYQAVDALARFAKNKTAAAALKAATADPDRRVAQRARAALD
jgi:hypothetical protein